MYLVNKNFHVVETIEFDKTEVDKSIACYSSQEELQIDFPTITDDMLPYIPLVCAVTNEYDCVDYYLNSKIETRTFISLHYYGQTIQDWMKEQAETFSTEDGICY